MSPSTLIWGYGNLITVKIYSGGTIDADAALEKGKGDADAHLFVPGEQWEMQCRSAYAIQSIYVACRRELWSHAKARLEANGY